MRNFNWKPVVLTAFLVFAAKCEFVIDVHLVPADLVDHDHGAFRFERVELPPQPSLLFLYLLWRFGWLDASGVTRSGTPGAWLMTFIFIIYEIILYQFPLFGNGNSFL